MSASRAWVKYAVTTAVCALWGALILRTDGYSAALPVTEKYRFLCDALTVPGLMVFLVGVLTALANEGSFNAISYAVRYAVRRLIPGTGGQKETYADYVERRREKRVRGYGFLFHVGGAFFAAGIVFLLLFLRAGG